MLPEAFTFASTERFLSEVWLEGPTVMGTHVAAGSLKSSYEATSFGQASASTGFRVPTRSDLKVQRFKDFTLPSPGRSVHGDVLLGGCTAELLLGLELQQKWKAFGRQARAV